MTSTIKTGTILTAHPDLDDPDFGKSVMLVVSHNENGAIAVNLASKKTSDDTTFEGGPMSAGQVLLIHAGPDTGDKGFGVIPIPLALPLTALGKQVLSNLDSSRLHAKIGPMMMVTGYAGWGPGQIENEQRGGVWAVSNATVADLLAVPAEERWEKARNAAPAVEVKAENKSAANTPSQSRQPKPPGGPGL